MRSVRELVEGDEHVLQELIESVPWYAERVTGYPPGPADGLSALLSLPPDLDPANKVALGLWEDDSLVAFADVLLQYPTSHHAYVGVLLVRGGAHRSGLGAAMHAGVVERVRQVRGVSRLRLGIIQTVADDVEPFWRAIGYEPTGETKPYRYGSVDSEVALWERTL